MSDHLTCDHCGDVAIESADGLFRDGDGGPCLSCGMPGQVTVDEYEDPPTAYWTPSEWDESAWCNRADCEDCARVRRDAEKAMEGEG